MKIFCDYPDVVKAAMVENYAGLEFVETAEDADVVMPKIKFPVRIGEVLKLIEVPENYEVDGLLIDLKRCEVKCGGKVLGITEKEMAILKCLIKNPRGATRKTMLEEIWGYSENVNTATIESHIYRLKNKIAGIFGDEIITSANGVYKLAGRHG